MKFDVYADLDHLFMLNFSADAEKLSALVPSPLKVLSKDGRGFPSIVLPSIKRLRPVLTRFPSVDYELFGLRILVEYDSVELGRTKGIYFSNLIMDPNWARLIANQVTSFDFERGTIQKRAITQGSRTKQIQIFQQEKVLDAEVTPSDEFPSQLTSGSCFDSAEDALSMYNDIAYGFLPFCEGKEVQILQIADPHPNYVAWPLTHLEVSRVWVKHLHANPIFEKSDIVLEASYYVGFLPRYWRWLKTENL